MDTTQGTRSKLFTIVDYSILPFVALFSHFSKIRLNLTRRIPKFCVVYPNLIRVVYPNFETIWIVSDKCSNFNSFEQIPFIVAGNERAWALPKISSFFNSIIPEARSRSNRKKLQVGKWLFTEAQDDRADQLGCHFAWIKASFKAHNDTEGNKVNVPEDMFLTLQSISTDIMNTHMLYGNTTHPTINKKFPMKQQRSIKHMNIPTLLWRVEQGSGLKWPTTAEYAHRTSRRRRLSKRLMKDM